MAGNSTKNGLAHLANIAALQAQKPETKVVKLQAIFRTQKRINFLRRGLAQLVAEARDAGALGPRSVMRSKSAGKELGSGSEHLKIWLRWAPEGSASSSSGAHDGAGRLCRPEGASAPEAGAGGPLATSACVHRIGGSGMGTKKARRVPLNAGLPLTGSHN